VVKNEEESMKQEEILRYAREAVLARWAIEQQREKAGSQIAASLCRKYEEEMRYLTSQEERRGIKS
jgi:hypothetical protein